MPARPVLRRRHPNRGEPSWRLGDPVGLCLDDTNSVGVLTEVAARPAFDPSFVAAQSGSAEDAERWPWVTEVRVVSTSALDSAPTLEELQIPVNSMQQRTYTVYTQSSGCVDDVQNR